MIALTTAAMFGRYFCEVQERLDFGQFLVSFVILAADCTSKTLFVFCYLLFSKLLQWLSKLFSKLFVWWPQSDQETVQYLSQRLSASKDALADSGLESAVKKLKKVREMSNKTFHYFKGYFCRQT